VISVGDVVELWKVFRLEVAVDLIDLGDCCLKDGLFMIDPPARIYTDPTDTFEHGYSRRYASSTHGRRLVTSKWQRSLRIARPGDRRSATG